MRKSNIVIGLLSLLLMSSCASQLDKIEVGDVYFQKVENFRSIDGVVSVDCNLAIEAMNPTGLRVLLSDLDATLYTKNGSRFADISIADGKNITIEKRRDSLYVVPLVVTVNNPLALLTVGKDLLKGIEKSGMTMDYSFNIKSSVVKRAFAEERVSVDKFIEQLKKL